MKHDGNLQRLFQPKEPIDYTKKIIGQFYLGKTLGQGTFGKVKLGTHIITGDKAAIKILQKIKILDEADKKRIDREIKILKSVMHHNIARIYSVIETPQNIFLIMEYCNGGELFNYIVLKKRMSEHESLRIFHQILNAVEYLHKLGIVHRDLKPENILLDCHKEIKLVDFGLSNIYSKNESLQTACGSPCYAAPEMIEGKPYDGLKVDLWSCGVILFAMLCGHLPFDDTNEDNLYLKITKGKYKLPNFLSGNAKDLIRKILNIDPSRRLNVKQIRSHPWFNIIPPIINESLFIHLNPIPIDEAIVAKLISYGYKKEEIREQILSNKHNDITTLYYLIVKSNYKKGISSVSDLNSNEFKSHLMKTKTHNGILALSNETDRNKQNDRNSEHNCDNAITVTYLKTEDAYDNSYNKKEELIIFNDEQEQIEDIDEFFRVDDTLVNQLRNLSPTVKPLTRKTNVAKSDRCSITSKLKEHYEKYIKNKTKIKKGFINTSVIYEPHNEIKKRTRSVHKANSPSKSSLRTISITKEKKGVPIVNLRKLKLKQQIKFLNKSCPEIDDDKSNKSSSRIKNKPVSMMVKLNKFISPNIKAFKPNSEITKRKTKVKGNSTPNSHYFIPSPIAKPKTQRCVSLPNEKQITNISFKIKNLTPLKKYKQLSPIIKEQINSMKSNLENQDHSNVNRTHKIKLPMPKPPKINFSLYPNMSPTISYVKKYCFPKANLTVTNVAKRSGSTMSLLSTKLKEPSRTIKRLSLINHLDTELSYPITGSSSLIKQNLLSILEKNKISKRQTGNLHKFQCNKNGIRFNIEINSNSSRQSAFIKFNMIDGALIDYKDLCQKILAQLKI